MFYVKISSLRYFNALRAKDKIPHEFISLFLVGGESGSWPGLAWAKLGFHEPCLPSHPPSLPASSAVCLTPPFSSGSKQAHQLQHQLSRVNLSKVCRRSRSPDSLRASQALQCHGSTGRGSGDMWVLAVSLSQVSGPLLT